MQLGPVARARRGLAAGLAVASLPLAIVCAVPAWPSLRPRAVGHPGVARPQPPPFEGTLKGNYALLAGPGDTGATYSLSAFGILQPPGPVQVAGSLHTPGFVRAGNAAGSLMVSGQTGTLTLAVQGPTQPGFSPPPQSLEFAITDATGQFAGMLGSGSVTLRLTPAPGDSERRRHTAVRASPGAAASAPNRADTVTGDTAREVHGSRSAPARP